MPPYRVKRKKAGSTDMTAMCDVAFLYSTSLFLRQLQKHRNHQLIQVLLINKNRSRKSGDYYRC
jgi:hypothetical protein